MASQSVVSGAAVADKARRARVAADSVTKRPAAPKTRRMSSLRAVVMAEQMRSSGSGNVLIHGRSMKPSLATSDTPLLQNETNDSVLAPLGEATCLGIEVFKCVHTMFCIRSADGALVRSYLMLLNAVLSSALAVVLLEISWDPDVRNFVDGHPGGEAIKWVLLGLSLVLVGQICEYYRHLYLEKRSLLARGVDSRDPRVWPLRWWEAIPEVLLCVITPLPGGLTSNKVALVVFLRLYQTIRVAHRSSPLFRLRSQIWELCKGSGESVTDHVSKVEFGVLLSLKTMFEAQPGLFMVTILAFTYFPLALTIYVQERGREDAEYWDLGNSLWFVAAVMCTVGAEIEPFDPVSRLVSILACFVGVTIMSLAVLVVARTLELTDAEAIVHEITGRLQTSLATTQQQQQPPPPPPPPQSYQAIDSGRSNSDNTPSRSGKSLWSKVRTAVHEEVDVEIQPLPKKPPPPPPSSSPFRTRATLETVPESEPQPMGLPLRLMILSMAERLERLERISETNQQKTDDAVQELLATARSLKK